MFVRIHGCLRYHYFTGFHKPSCFWFPSFLRLWEVNSLVFKSAVASLLEPQPALLRHYAEQTLQEAPQALSPVERLKKAFQEFTDSIETEGLR